MNTEFRITENEARYLMLIYRRQIEESSEVSTTGMAKLLNVKPATVTEVIRNLSKKNLLKHRPYRGVELTKRGIKEARKLLRKHRILELLFVDFLKYDVRKSCIEASKIDYHASMSLINDICRVYGHPGLCPCEKAIFANSHYIKSDTRMK